MIKGYIFVILSAVMFGCMPLITRYIYNEGINRESVVLMRNFLTLPILAIFTHYQSKSFKISIKALPSIIVIAVIGCCVTPLLLYGSYEYIATGIATVFHFIYPAIVVLIGVFFLRKKIKIATVSAVVICVIGVCLFYNPSEPLNWRGCILALASGITYAIYVVLLSHFQNDNVSGFKLSFYISSICSVVMLIVCLFSDKLVLPSTLTGWVLCILLSVLINVGAVVMFQKGTFYIGGERASVLSTLEPITGVILGIVAFNEKITIYAVLGSIMVIIACILIATVDVKKKVEKFE